MGRESSPHLTLPLAPPRSVGSAKSLMYFSNTYGASSEVIGFPFVSVCVSYGPELRSLGIPNPCPSRMVEAGRHHLGKGAGLWLEVTLGVSLGCPGASSSSCGITVPQRGGVCVSAFTGQLQTLVCIPFPKGS